MGWGTSADAINREERSYELQKVKSQFIEQPQFLVYIVKQGNCELLLTLMITLKVAARASAIEH